MLRSIPLRTFDAPISDTENLTSAMLFRTAVSAPKQGGVTVDSMRRAMIVLDGLDKASDALLLDEAHWQFLRDAMNTCPWGAFSPHIVTATDDVINAEKVDPNK
ncbi:hypothetical protein [Acidiphilium sp.]|uniref:hypothetical protein n=1 Tax=Acidiphilium sp. TaxID=527 RepID=UPI003D03EEA0